MSRQQWGEKAIPERVAERAATQYVVDGDCYISTYSTASHGYAQVGWQESGKNHGSLAHRAAWTYYYGPIPVGMTIDHRQGIGCKSRRCIRREHLRMLPNLENARRTAGRDWQLGTCRHGHGPEWWRPKGPTRAKGYCHACRMERQQRDRGTGRRRVYSRLDEAA